MQSEDLDLILQIQEKDIQMMRLLRLRNERETELSKLHKLRADLENQASLKKSDIEEFEKELGELDAKIESIAERMRLLEETQNSIKRVDEFNALTQEMTKLDREKAALSKSAQELSERMESERQVLETIETSLKESYEGSRAVEQEIQESIEQINKEGAGIKTERDAMAKGANADILTVYEKLLKNKKDRVVVPVVARACTGCNVLVTPQHENLVRKGERLVFCEHCSRIHYWPQQVESGDEASAATTTRRRRRRTTV